jgi:quercetin dioxygenase-like cupin family protein
VEQKPIQEKGSLDAAKVEELQSLVNYQEGAVVSRTLIKKETGTVTLFAFDAGQGLSEHTTPFDAMILVIDGEANIIIEGKSYNLTQGQTIIMPAHKPHAVKAENRFKMMLIMIRS